jgi:hypothetical protein
MALHLCGALQVGFDVLCQLLAELHAYVRSSIRNHSIKSNIRQVRLPPLVIRIDIPNHALHEDLVLIHGNERAQREWRYFGQDY